jgi:hypothetical protein
MFIWGVLALMLKGTKGVDIEGVDMIKGINNIDMTKGGHNQR